MKRKILSYNPYLKQFAKELRNKSTLAEAILWNHLKSRKLNGFKFSRQRPIGNYIVDFFSSELMLGIEIDGSSHNEKIEKDFKRQKELESQNITLLRFSDSEVQRNIEGVILYISEWINTRK
jgi:very-short-patch-repair endonuclease